MKRHQSTAGWHVPSAVLEMCDREEGDDRVLACAFVESDDDDPMDELGDYGTVIACMWDQKILWAVVEIKVQCHECGLNLPHPDDRATMAGHVMCRGCADRTAQEWANEQRFDEYHDSPEYGQ